MAPKTQPAYQTKDASLQDVRPNDFREITQFLANFHELAHNLGGLRHAIARLELNDIKKLEYECNVWRVEMLKQCRTSGKQDYNAGFPHGGDLRA